MLPRINPSDTQAWLLLKKHYKEEMIRIQMRTLFANESERFEKLSIQFGNILFDYSKNIITDKTKQLLLQLANECSLKEAIEAQFAGQAINETENRAVLHTALRNFSDNTVLVDGADIMPEIKRVLKQMKTF